MQMLFWPMDDVIARPLPGKLVAPLSIDSYCWSFLELVNTHWSLRKMRYAALEHSTR